MAYAAKRDYSRKLMRFMATAKPFCLRAAVEARLGWKRLSFEHGHHSGGQRMNNTLFLFPFSAASRALQSLPGLVFHASTELHMLVLMGR